MPGEPGTHRSSAIPDGTWHPGDATVRKMSQAGPCFRSRLWGGLLHLSGRLSEGENRPAGWSCCLPGLPLGLRSLPPILRHGGQAGVTQTDFHMKDQGTSTVLTWPPTSQHPGPRPPCSGVYKGGAEL